MITRLEWFNELPEPFRSQAIVNQRAQHGVNSLSQFCDNFHEALSEGFTWEESPQGHFYWYWINVRMLNGHSLTDTNENWINRMKLSHGREEALSECDYLEGLSCRLNLAAMFAWNRTPSGHDYWKSIDKIYGFAEIEPMEDYTKYVNFSDSFSKMLKNIKDSSSVATSLLIRRKTTNEFCDYITMRGDMCSYLPAGREHKISENGRWARDGRQDMKPAKLARKILIDETLTDSDYEKFSNIVKSYISVTGDDDGEGKKIELKIVSGEKIRECYLEDNYSKLLGKDSNLFSSCMRYESCQEYLDIYCDNDVCSLLVAFDFQGKVLGRALLWKLREGMAMDTIYSNESLFQAFIKWAIDNKYYYKSSQSCHHHYFDMFDNNNRGRVSSYVRLSHFDYSYYPYMDSLYNLSDNGVLSNDGEDWRTLRQTDGGFEDNCIVYDSFSGEDVREEDCSYLSYRYLGRVFEGYCHERNVVETYNGEFVYYEHTEEGWKAGRAVVILTDDEDFYCVNDEYHHIDDLVTDVTNDELILQIDAVNLHDGDCTHEDNAEECLVDGKNYLRSDMTEVEDGWVAIDNMEEYLETLKEKENEEANEEVVN
jgi:hypothetical protein